MPDDECFFTLGGSSAEGSAAAVSVLVAVAVAAGVDEDDDDEELDEFDELEGELEELVSVDATCVATAESSALPRSLLEDPLELDTAGFDAGL